MGSLHLPLSPSSSNKYFFHTCQITFLCYTIFILNVDAQRHELPNGSLSKISNHHIKSNLSWIGPLVSSSTTGNRFVVNINITFTPEMCCPQFVLLSESMDSIFIEDGCYNVSPEMLRALHTASINEHYIEIDPSALIKASEQYTDDLTSCIQSRSTGMYKCRMRHFLYLGTPKNVSLYAYYLCFERQRMDFTVHISLLTDVVSYECTALKTNSPCYTFYQAMYPPNGLGSQIIQDADLIYGFANVLMEKKCHQHMLEFLCRIIFPECTTLGSISPCRTMCFEVMLACSNFAKYFLETYLSQIKDFQFAINYVCMQYPDGGLCYTKNVTCGSPAQIEHGILHYSGPSIVPVHSTTMYECDEDYKLEGNSTSVCEYSGEWSAAPQCIPISNKRQMIILGATFGAFAGMTLIAILVGVIFRHEIVVILYAKFGIRFNKNKEEEKKYDAFIAYSQEDIGFVKHQLLRPLEKMTPKFKICIHHRDFCNVASTSFGAILSLLSQIQCI